jgi:ADP-ribose pyrophosphatase
MYSGKAGIRFFLSFRDPGQRLDDRYMTRSFKTVSTEEVYRDFYSTFNLLRVETDGVAKVFPQLVRHPGSIIIPLSPSGRTVMIRQYRYAGQKIYWEFCAGKIEDGEEPYHTALRELAEEVGLIATVVQPLGVFDSMPDTVLSEVHVYAARVDDAALDQLIPPTDEDEICEVHVLSLDQLAQMAGRGEIGSGMTLAAYALLLTHLGAEQRHG